MSRADSPLRGRLIFLVGAQRSGTNWLQRMLAVHPDVVSLPSETQLISVGVRRLEPFVHQGTLQSWSTGRAFMERGMFLDSMRDFCDACLGDLAQALDPTARNILERSPNHAEHLDLVAEIYPDARVVHIVRDGRDVARSLVAQAWGPAQVAEAARTWRHAVETARKAAPGLAAYVEVRYEDLVTDTAATYRTVLTGLSLGVDEAVVATAVDEAAVPVNVDRTQPTVGPGKWRTSWSAEDLAAFDAEAGDLLYDELGYPHEAVVPKPAAPRRTPSARAKSLVRRLRPAAPSPRPTAAPAATQNRAGVAQRVVDDVLGHLAGGRPDLAEPMLAPTAEVRLVSPDADRHGRGAAGRVLLAEVSTADGATWGRQVRGEVHSSNPTTVTVLSHEHDGVVTDRTVVLDVKDGLVTELTCYLFARRPVERTQPVGSHET